MKNIICVGDANAKMCPFADTTSFTNSGINFCIADSCMSWIKTKTLDNSMGNNKPIKKEWCEGYCSLVKEDKR